jgi:hypothetical protein
MCISANSPYHKIWTLFPYFLVALLAFLCSSFVLSQPVNGANTQYVKSFITASPDTILQGESFDVKYILKSSSWKSGVDVPLQKNGFKRTRIRYATSSDAQYSTLTVTVSYQTSNTGQMELPVITIPVGNHRVASASKSVYVKSNRAYGKEMSYAHNWLLMHGQHHDSLCLQMVIEDEGFWVFSDLQNKCFCMVANQDVWPLLDLPVLAYSTESVFYSEHRNSRGTDNLLSPYRAQNLTLKKNANRNTHASHHLYAKKHHEVLPLLAGTKWDQSHPYNLSTSTVDGKKAYVGCVPLAVAMVMNYHQWPEVGTSYTYYKYLNEKIFKLDFSESRPQWKLYKEEYKV